jgi:transcriptional regulator GlxA family with amidase domain
MSTVESPRWHSKAGYRAGRRAARLTRNTWSALQRALRRIEGAKRLLESSDLVIREVGFGIGYEDPSFFRRSFKCRTGVDDIRSSPTAPATARRSD